MSSRIQFRRGTAAQWTAANPVLAAGEPSLETDTVVQKLGDGVTAYNSLPASVAPLNVPGGTAKLGSDGTVGGPGGSALTSSVVAASSQPFAVPTNRFPFRLAAIVDGPTAAASGSTDVVGLNESVTITGDFTGITGSDPGFIWGRELFVSTGSATNDAKGVTNLIGLNAEVAIMSPSFAGSVARGGSSGITFWGAAANTATVTQMESFRVQAPKRQSGNTGGVATNAYGLFIEGVIGSAVGSSSSFSLYQADGIARFDGANARLDVAGTITGIQGANGGQLTLVGGFSNTPSIGLYGGTGGASGAILFRLGRNWASAYYTFADAGNTTFLKLTNSRSVVIGPGAALATNATDGFVYLPTTAGIPSGTPTAQTGSVAAAYDTTDNLFYIYNGTWQTAGTLGSRQILIDAFATPKATSGAGVWSTSVSNVAYNCGYLHGSGASTVGDTITFYDVWIDAGTWQVDILGYLGTDGGQCSISLGASTFSGTIEFYAASGSATRQTLTGLVIASSGLRTLTITITGHNASSTSYAVRFSGAILTRTA